MHPLYIKNAISTGFKKLLVLIFTTKIPQGHWERSISKIRTCTIISERSEPARSAGLHCELE
jgi:hypothetical protein